MNQNYMRQLPEEQVVWMSHGDLVTGLPEGFVVDATSASCPIAAMSNEAENYMLCNSIQKYVTLNTETI